MSLVCLWIIVIFVILMIILFHSQIHDTLFGVGIDRPMSGWTFEAMTKFMHFLDFFHDTQNRLDEVEIKQGMTICDMGTGPGRLLTRASEMVGKEGKVYAVDNSPNSKYYVEKVIETHNLNNVEFVLVRKELSDEYNDKFDIVFAFDMFHYIKDHVSFLRMIHRILKPKGMFYIDGGHQSKSSTLKKIEDSKVWKISGFGKDSLFGHQLVQLAPIIIKEEEE